MALFFVFGAAALFLNKFSFGGHYANVYVDGVSVLSVDLRAVSEGYTTVIETEDGGRNVLRIEKGRICVESANCRDGICVNSGWIEDTVRPIICLPHRVVIKIEKVGVISSGSFDAVVK